MKIELDLDTIFDSRNCESVSQIITDELRYVVKAEVKKAIKADKNLQGLIRKLHHLAVTQAIETLTKKKEV